MVDFDRDIIIVNTASERQENTINNEGIGDGEFTVDTYGKNLTVNGKTVNVKTLEKCFTERIDREMSNIFDTVEKRIQT